GLPKGGRIAVVANDAIGNFVVATPLLQMLRRQHAPSAIDFYGGFRTQELELASDLIDCSFPAHGTQLADVALHISRRPAYDLVVNNESTGFAKAVTALLCGKNTFVAGPSFSDGRGDLLFPDD